MSKFGEWHYDGGKLIRNADGKVIADILSILDWLDPWREISAYGQLIAAAPEMYKFIESAFLTKDSRHLNWEVLVKSAGELLARIDGEEA